MWVNTSILPFLFRFLFTLALPPTSVIVVFRLVASHHADIGIPLWLVVLTAGISTPVTFAFRVFWTQLRIRREAASMGAVLPPVCPGNYPGKIDTLIKLMDEFNNGYPGTFPFFFQIGINMVYTV